MTKILTMYWKTQILLMTLHTFSILYRMMLMLLPYANLKLHLITNPSFNKFDRAYCRESTKTCMLSKIGACGVRNVDLGEPPRNVNLWVYAVRLFHRATRLTLLAVCALVNTHIVCVSTISLDQWYSTLFAQKPQTHVSCGVIGHKSKQIEI